ncbi:MAG: SDR family oxidoreductase, partial [bacterium]
PVRVEAVWGVKKSDFLSINPMDMTGKRVLVTGASSGIGRACAVLLSKLGAELILLARTVAQLEETRTLAENGRQHCVVPFDLACTDRIGDLGKIYALKENKIHGVVHAAGIMGVVPINATSPKYLSDMLCTNFNSYVELCRVLSKRFYTYDGASFVAISSTASQAAWKGGVAYCASKAALDAATRVLALELAERKIRVNTVLPSYIRTKIVETAGDAGVDTNAYVAQKQPLGIGEPEDVAHAVAFLLSDASRFITGTQMVVDGGYLAQ